MAMKLISLPKLVKAFSVVWLLFASTASMLAVIFGLTAFQIQNRLQKFSTQGEAFSVWRLDRIREEQRQIKQSADRALARQGQAAANLNLNREAGSEIREILSRLDLSSWSALIALRTVVVVADPSLAPKLEDGNLRNQYHTLLANLKSLNLYEANKVEVSKYETDTQAYFHAKQKMATLDTRNSEIIEEIKSIKAELQDLNRQRSELLSDNTSLSRGDRNTILDFASEMDVLDKRVSAVRLLTAVPNELLLILLVVSMGILGSTIRIIQDIFSSNHWRSPFEHIFLNFLGALTALALFVVVKAGVIVSIEPRPSGGSGVELNPFLLAFLGIIAGLISERAVGRIRHWGEEWLASPNLERPRYARGLASRMTEKKKSPDELAKYFDAPPELISEWLTERTPIPLHAQAIISAWLDVPMRDLFSDVPETASTAAAKQGEAGTASPA